ncbi:hypothetical protein GCM10010885_21970 [Alicyclobacillus cellulosilyticus]|uniref:Uncharacterized protein n=1 Tax=Alicyclobacillus cellulosilyticus TaxID=1003997 RepID=A0A917NMY1_9BACL|nr:hypothetical protein [Alicyclobacillus cellulosilyticus]GGJ12210.1 hypothetical protein GCM10010885_21970 [Alicyclobacillus cellulosilyticus]
MEIRRLAGRVRTAIARADQKLVTFVQSHANLTTALVTAGLALWALSTHQSAIVLRMAAAGAVGYFLGLTPAVCVGALSVGFSVAISLEHGFSISNLIIEVIGAGCSAWLGYQHKMQKVRQEQAADPHAPQVLPWAVVNEIRTSLAAIRFLLFPLHDEEGSRENQALQQATQELSRLEALFREMEQRDRAGEGR